MHLLSKKLKSSPTAKRIPPPAMPITLPLSASSATSAFSFNPEPNSSASRRRMSRIGTAVKALSRPTTPATDHRLRDELDVGFSFSRRNSVMQHNRNEPKEGKLSSSRGSPHAPRSLSGSHRPNSYKHVLVSNSPLFPASESSPSSFLGERQKAAKKHFGRPHTAGFALSKSLKHMSGALAGKMATLNRPATAGARSNEFKSTISRPENSSFRINFRLSRFETGRQQALPYVHDDGRSSQPHPPWRMPTDEEIDRMLEKAQGFVAAHQQRLEILNRSRGDSKDVSTERFDSSHDNTLQSENLPAPPPPLQSRHHFTGRPIASPRTLERWGKPENGKRRPSTASGTPSEGFMNAPLAGRLSSRTISKRPHTSDGPHQDSTWLPSYPQSQNASTSSLGLPHPPRKQRPSAGKAG
ncbi:hypothetical protein M408DRAFT_149873 [Serendipita vermifera MAFF 305830]|uniref:Uncharacterized protein n=1 Tax=Serendipita vermifera MAFF 305830 TaxID=933852 RepID=A0A0C3BP07_SERVB|nr:hypothetical protein M408DRAFT_149873 [Serendipita vermifera MAFF 305830]